MIGRLNLSNSNDGGGIKGLVEAYKAHGVIDAGDFVQFVSDYSQVNEVKDTRLSSQVNGGLRISAVALSATKVFIAYNGKTSNSYLYGVVCTIDGTTITIGKETELSSIEYSGMFISAVALSATKVFIAHNYDGTNYYLSGIVCTIDGTTITKGTDTKLSLTNRSGSVISAVKLDEGKVFIAHSYSKDGYFYLSGMICTINGISVARESDIQLSNEKSSGATMSVVALDNNRVFIANSR